MSTLTLHRYDTNETIFESSQPSIKKTIEQAIIENIDLSYVDLSNADLKDIELDDAQIHNANFRGTDLRGANMSEGNFKGSDFSNALLQGACFNESDLTKCAFIYSRFGDTDCAGTVFCDSVFGGLSVFSLKFIEAQQLNNCLYIHTDSKSYAFSDAPICLMGLKEQTILLDTHYIEGDQIHPHHKLFTNAHTNIPVNSNEYSHLILAIAYETGRFQKVAH